MSAQQVSVIFEGEELAYVSVYADGSCSFPCVQCKTPLLYSVEEFPYLRELWSATYDATEADLPMHMFFCHSCCKPVMEKVQNELPGITRKALEDVLGEEGAAAFFDRVAQRIKKKQARQSNE